MSMMNALKSSDTSNGDYGAKILDRYPGFKKAYPEGIEIRNASEDRMKQAPQWTETRQSEFYHPGQMGGEQEDMLPNPTSGRRAFLEIYDPKIQSDPKAKKELIVGELLHGAKRDPVFKKLRDEFTNSFSPEAQSSIFVNMKDKTSDLYAYPGETYSQMMDRSGTDAYLRGHFMPRNNGEWANQYSPTQKELVKKMEKYLKSGKEPK